MPELPEVHTIVSDLDKHITDHTIEKIAIAKRYNVFPNREGFIKGALHKKIVGVERLAKNIIIKLDSGYSLVFHLAMTGRLLIRSPDHKEDQWVRVLLVIRKYAIEKHLRFSDMRMFGKAKLMDSVELENLEASLGIELLGDTITLDKFIKNLKSKRTNVKNVLLNQKIFSGIGNIYATEALFIAKIHPETPTAEIDTIKAKRLLEAIRKVLSEGIENRGSTLPDKMYVDAFGKEGKQQEHFRVYLKRRCGVCGSEISYMKLNSRGTYFCPVCQPPGGQKKLI